MADTIEALRRRVDILLADVKNLPEPDRTMLLREVRARFAASIETPTRRAASSANMTRINEAREKYGISEETRAKLSDARKAAWARKKAQANDNTSQAASASQE